MNLKLVVKLPNLKKNTVLGVEASFTPDNFKILSLVVEKFGPEIKLNILTGLFTPNIPFAVTPFTLMTKINFEIDYSQLLLMKVPATTLDVQVLKDEMALVKCHLSSQENSIVLTLSVPALLPKPLQCSVFLGTLEEYGVKIFADILIPLTMDIVMQKDLTLAKIELNINKINIFKVTAIGEMVLAKLIPEMLKY